MNKQKISQFVEVALKTVNDFEGFTPSQKTSIVDSVFVNFSKKRVEIGNLYLSFAEVDTDIVENSRLTIAEGSDILFDNLGFEEGFRNFCRLALLKKSDS